MAGLEVFTKADSERMRAILRAGRKRASMNQTELAARVGLGRNTLMRIERNPEMASIETFYRIARELNMSPRRMLKEARQRVAPKAGL